LPSHNPSCDPLLFSLILSESGIYFKPFEKNEARLKKTVLSVMICRYTAGENKNAVLRTAQHFENQRSDMYAR
jgi:hypothetical protein